ncbi:endolytic transglycosylase MltG [Kroppenstedtia eburnea]|uniref:endolytic transglycosylase MltG n=1 Tax=Kroppenstedtia eburnea TaxID=714067 RepID=UPI00362C5621
MKWLLRLFFTFLMVGLFSALGYWYVEHSLSPSSVKQPVEVEVKPGDSILNVGRELERKELIKDDFLFVAYAFLKGRTKDLKAGVYEVPPGSGTPEILNIFTDGSQNVMRLTVPEGFTAEKIAAVLDKKGLDGDEFLQAVNRKEDYPDSFVKEIPSDRKRRYQLEGYLYPITYNLPKGTDSKHLVQKMLQQFERNMEREGIRPKLKEQNLTMDEWVTIASIIEREGKVEEEFPRIAGVIYNRLKVGKKLQVDATVQYALGEQKARLLYKDLEIKSPYNTYRIKGLPPSPISNPGPKALRAALEPEKHPYFYYVTRKDGSGLHYFARTEKEHLQNIERSKKEAAKEDGSQ